MTREKKTERRFWALEAKGDNYGSITVAKMRLLLSDYDCGPELRTRKRDIEALRQKRCDPAYWRTVRVTLTIQPANRKGTKR